jgi:hypothetical protein
VYENSFPSKRYKHTIEFLKEVIPDTQSTILDLGVRNPFVDFMEREGYTVTNTLGEDLDVDTTAVQHTDATVITAFEIFEHLLAPFNVLKDIKAKKIVASVPLKLWFSPAYQSKTDPWDRHYHEFEDWQFDWLFEKAGWEIKKREKFTNPVKKIGIRPILRNFTPRYYLVYAERKI